MNIESERESLPQKKYRMIAVQTQKATVAILAIPQMPICQK
jgi:hypothetical protein